MNTLTNIFIVGCMIVFFIIALAATYALLKVVSQL